MCQRDLSTLQKTTRIRGISLVEVAMTALILGVLFMVSARFFKTSAKVALEARQTDSAIQLIEKMTADLRKTNFYFILGADSDVKGGTSLTFNHENYMVNWNKSQMKNTLVQFEQMVRQAGFTRFKITCWLLFRPNVNGTRSSSEEWVYESYANNPTKDWRDPSRMRFIDRDGDGQYYNAIFDALTKKWIPELPPVSIKALNIQIINGNRVVGQKEVRLDLNDYSRDPTESRENKVKVAFFLPNGLYFHERVTEFEKYLLDMPIDKPPLPIYGLTEACRERRFDTVTDPVHGYGGMVVQGQTLPGAVLSVYTYAQYTNCSNCPWTPTGRSMGTPQQMNVTDKTGVFTMILDDRMMQKILADKADMAAKYSREFSLIGRAALNGNTSADVKWTYGFQVLTDTPTVTNIRPVGTQTTLAPPVSFNSVPSWPRTETVSFMLDNVQQYGAAEVGGRVTMASGVNPFPRLPPILSNHSVHTVNVNFADNVCYKATASWTFSVDVGPDSTPPDIDCMFSGLSPGDTRLYSFRIYFYDPESGIDYRTIEVLLDGLPLKDSKGNQGTDFVNANYDPKSTRFYFDYIPAPPKGHHTFTIKASNFAEGGPLTSVQDFPLDAP